MRRLLAILLAAMPAANAAAQTVRFPSLAAGPAAAGPPLSGWLYRPSGAGPFPGIVLAHTCGGVSEHTDIWGKRLAAWGYVVVAPDSFGPRGYKAVCTNGAAVTGNMRVADVAGALEFLRRQTFVVGDRLGLIGHSHGGWTTVRSVQRAYGLAQHGLRAAVAYYPLCQPAFDTGVDVPLLILIGDKDDWTLAENCRRLQAAGFTRPELVEAIYYPNAYHSFDSDQPNRTVAGANSSSHRLAFDPTAAADAEARTKAFFEKHLR